MRHINRLGGTRMFSRIVENYHHDGSVALNIKMIAIFISYLMISYQANIINGGRLNVSSTRRVTALLGKNATLVCQWLQDTACTTTTTTTTTTSWLGFAVSDDNCTDNEILRKCTEPSHQTLEHKSCNWTIMGAQLKDGGKYKCQVVSCLSNGEAVSELIVNVPPTAMVLSNQTHNFTETDNVTIVYPGPYRLNCSVYGSKPAAEIRWILNGRSLTEKVTNATINSGEMGLWNTHSQLTGIDGGSLVCLASFPAGSAIPSQQRQLHIQGDLHIEQALASTHTSSDTTGSSYTHVTTLSTSKPATMGDVTDAKYTIVPISVSACFVAIAAVLLVTLVVVYRKRKKKKGRRRLPSQRIPTDPTRINTQIPTVVGAVFNQSAGENDYQERGDVITDHAPEIPARAPPPLPSQESVSAVLGAHPRLVRQYGHQVLFDNFTPVNSATNNVEMKATVLSDVRSHSAELVYADLALNHRADVNPTVQRSAEEPTVYARFNFNEQGDFQVSSDEGGDGAPPPVPPRMVRWPSPPPEDQWQPGHMPTEGEDMPFYLEECV
ncbi:uncharacterized protein LOC117301583 isoform X2 [Asterias rubens]|uniref:uncharacterized protein LOC117301583 isoform X2 n=1 Tax=Asterias rubens TaxID=7604 RepID=UPI0014555066|nr:uncharacterized protein LOC117301583 isoform X2 [Asterias rubens]